MESTLTRRCPSCGFRYDAATATCPVDGKPLPPADPRAAELGQFVLVERLGDGGMGTVYKAVHRRLGRVVAIKLLHRDLTTDRALVGRFFYEARAANTIRHAHVVEVYDFVETADDVYFVMELLKGEDLHEAIHRGTTGPMEPARAVAILEQIAAALHATHARNIVHRDLKPENVFLAEKDGRKDYVKVFDFGVAKLDRPDGRATVEGAVLGTPEYMAPEQASGHVVDGRADVYSLGCIAYEMLTRKQIFGGGIQADILIRQITWSPPPLREHAPTVPAGLELVVMRALAKDPEKRYKSARAFAEALARALGRDLSDPEAFRTVARQTPPGVPMLPPPARTLSLRRERAPLRRRLARVGVGVAAAGALVAAFVATRASRPSFEVAAQVRSPPPPPPAAPAPRVTVVLQSVPSGADVVDERDVRLGVTPFELALPGGRAMRVRFEKSGFRAASRDVVAAADTTIAVRLEPEVAAARPRARAQTATRAQEGATARLGDETTLNPFGEDPR
jgi:serine/threonine-protein kinase